MFGVRNNKVGVPFFLRADKWRIIQYRSHDPRFSQSRAIMTAGITWSPRLNFIIIAIKKKKTNFNNIIQPLFGTFNQKTVESEKEGVLPRVN